MKLLVVEDEARVASFLDKGLRANGYDVAWARSGHEALHRAAQPDISLVILDLGLPTWMASTCSRASRSGSPRSRMTSEMSGCAARWSASCPLRAHSTS